MPKSQVKAKSRGRYNQYEKRSSDILRAASKVMARDGFEGASIRKVAARSRIGLSGIYYYFKNKDELLFAIQFHTFSTLVETLKQRLKTAERPEDKLRAVIENHFRFFVDNMDDLKVCVHEIESLSGKYYNRVLKIRREYFHLVRKVIAEFPGGSRQQADLTALLLFGSLNWVYMWYDRRKNADIEKLSEQFCNVILNGIKNC